MNPHLLIGNIFFISSRVILFIFAITSSLLWPFLTIGIHFLTMLGWIIEQETSMNKNEKLDILKCLNMGLIYCFCFTYLENGNRHWRRRFFHFVTFVEGLILLILYSISSNHNLLIQMIGISSVTLTFLIGVIILEYGKCSEKNTKTDVELGNANHLQAKITASTVTVQNDQNNVENLENQPHPQAEESSVSSSKDMIEKCTDDAEGFAPLNRNKRETLCSIQDLLANTSIIDSLYDGKENKEKIESDVLQKETERQSNASINKVGLPVEDELESLSSSHSLSKNSFSRDVNPLAATTALPLSSLSSSNLNTNDKINHSKSLEGRNSSMKTSAENIKIVTLTNNSCDKNYGEIYDTVPAETPKDENDYSFIRPLMPNSICFLRSINDSSTAQSSGSHDYENIPAINVYRANTGVRHWKTYLDIEDRIHDYSTFKERSEIEDSTFLSNIYANNLILTSVSNTRPFSLAEQAGSHYSISLPDLSNIAPAACIEVESVVNEEHQDNLDTNEEKNPSNYEAIWYDDLERNENPEKDGSPQIIIGENGKIKDSLCNLYYSRISDLSSKYFIHSMKRNNSMSSVYPGTASEEQNRTYLSKPQLLYEVKTPDCATPVRNSVPAFNGKKFESKRTQKSPLMKLVTLSHNSFQEHTVKALQAGKRVFYRPRIHVITPKKETEKVKRRISLKSSSKDEDFINHIKIDPNILKRRTQLSPKDKLILSEASALIRKREAVVSVANPVTKMSPENLTLNHEIAQDGDTVIKENGNGGPQHSTPEGNRHLPQISILSTISSVTSPEENVKRGLDNFLSRKSCTLGENSIRTFSALQSGKRCNSKVGEMAVIEEFECVPSQV